VHSLNSIANTPQVVNVDLGIATTLKATAGLEAQSCNSPAFDMSALQFIYLIRTYKYRPSLLGLLYGGLFVISVLFVLFFLVLFIIFFCNDHVRFVFFIFSGMLLGLGHLTETDASKEVQAATVFGNKGRSKRRRISDAEHSHGRRV